MSTVAINKKTLSQALEIILITISGLYTISIRRSLLSTEQIQNQLNCFVKNASLGFRSYLYFPCYIWLSRVLMMYMKKVKLYSLEEETVNINDENIIAFYWYTLDSIYT